jgi:SNF2 family DNA or RNA helicase
MGALKAFRPDIVVVDESHHIKNATAKQTKAVQTITGSTDKVLLLTGTPLGKNNLDLYGQLKAIDPKIWKSSSARTGVMSWTDFRNNYALWGGRTGYELRGYINVDDLERRYKPHVRSARKEDIHDMPKVTHSVIPVDLPPLVRRAYNIFAEEGLIVWRRHMIEAPIPLTKLLRLQQMTGGWVHDEAGESVEIHREKIAVLADLLADLRASGRGVLVFARFLAEMAAIEEVAQKIYKGRTYQIRGGVASTVRRDIVHRFAKGGSFLVIQSGAAEALDGLQNNCAEAIFYSSDFSLIHWEQAKGRLDRVGQREPVTFYHLHARNTVDSLIFQALKDKKDLERMVMDNPEILLSR